MAVFVYMIMNLINGKKYIGASKDPEARFRRHFVNNERSLISRDMRLYGKQNFSLSLLKECDSEREGSYWERSFIKEYDTIEPNGYNAQGGILVAGEEREKHLEQWRESERIRKKDLERRRRARFRLENQPGRTK